MDGRIHCLAPVFNSDSKILILGTIPGAESLKSKTYYANKSNHFWDFIYRILKSDYPPYLPFDFDTPKEDRYQLLLSNGIALWDVISDCFRTGSNDSEIEDPQFNDISSFVENTQIKRILCNGNNALKYLKNSKELPKPSIPILKLNSTSSLNPNNTFYIFREWQLHLGQHVDR